MVTSFVKDLKQFALSVDIVNDNVLTQVGNLLKNYFKNSLRANAYEVRVPSFNGTMGEAKERFLQTLWWSGDGGGFTSSLHYEDKSVRGHTSYAVLNNKELWVVAKDNGFLEPDGQYEDLWSEVNDLPRYRDWGGKKFCTSVIIPLGLPAIGFLNLEFEQYFPPNEIIKEELQEITKAIKTIYELNDSHRVRTKNTENAVSSINCNVRCNLLRKPKLFFAFSSKADSEVIGIIREELESHNAVIDIISWDEIRQSGNINAQIKETIIESEYGVCYFSEPSKTNSQFVDNPNVVFEAGMFHASLRDGRSRWIPIRESNSNIAPFDFASERMVRVNRNNNGNLNTHKLKNDISTQLRELLKDY